MKMILSSSLNPLTFLNSSNFLKFFSVKEASISGSRSVYIFFCFFFLVNLLPGDISAMV